ncbi:DUF4169 family protein [Sphingobium scionense]
MSNVINFRLARKARDRADKAQAADSNRAKFDGQRRRNLPMRKKHVARRLCWMGRALKIRISLTAMLDVVKS